MTAETFDAVLAEGREEVNFRLMVRGENNTDRKLMAMLDRLAAAHAAEVAEQQAQLDHVNSLCNAYHARIAELEVAYLHYRPPAERADAATALLQKAQPFVATCPDLCQPGGDELRETIDAFLAQQAVLA